MSLYRRNGSSLWQYEFHIDGKRYRRSTGTTNEAVAIAMETRARAEICTPPINTDRSSATPREVASTIRTGRRAWVITCQEAGKITRNAAEGLARRQRWREIGEALLAGRTLNRDVTAFARWRAAERIDVSGRIAFAAMWLAENWASMKNLETKVSHPEQIRRLHKTGGLIQLHRRPGFPAVPFTTEQRAALRDTLNGIRSHLPRRVLIRYEGRGGLHYARIAHRPIYDGIGPIPCWPLVSLVSRSETKGTYQVGVAESSTEHFATFPEALRAVKVALLRINFTDPKAA